ncbi:MAG: BlaI/MecI/CopY family transcriptional regulator [Verrucomicrobia bacterium]|nr:BlaI/MecI/CopY family transcriptional regulator [Verrucomicrobiota bacterium]
MKAVPKISETEWEIMRMLWAEHPLTAAEIIERLAARDPTWHPKTVRTFLARLVRKRALDYEAQGRAYVYEPRVNERDCVAAASASFLDRVFGGSLRPMLAHFVEERRLSRSDLAELRRLLDGAAEGSQEKASRRSCKR